MIVANRIIDNQALLEGGGIAYEGDDALIAHNIITENKAGNGGGAISCVGSEPQYEESWRRLRIVGNRILGNDGGARGGGLELRNCGRALGGEEALVANNVFYGNFAATDATEGGGLVSVDSRVFVVNNTFVGNYVENESYTTYGGAIWSSGCVAYPPLRPLPDMLRAVNNIFYANSADVGCAVASTGSEDVLVAYCDAFPLDSAYYRVSPDAGCMWDDPKLCADSEEAPWAPQPISPIRTKGVNPSWGNGMPTVDIFGRPRPGPNGTTDMGAYEDAGYCRP